MKKFHEIRESLTKYLEEDVTENQEEISELSKKTLGNYVKAAQIDVVGHGMDLEKGGKDSKKAKKKIGQRYRGVTRATNRLTNESTAEIAELSKKTLGSYMKKAKASSDKLGDKENKMHNKRVKKDGDFYTPTKKHKEVQRKMMNRDNGVYRASNRLSK
jgi:phosphoglycerate-specific signal transduction histidine kinase